MTQLNKYSRRITQPKAQVGGPIALLQDGDRVTVDAGRREESF
jgi:dihydroxyacid dehydratase/phosphogluconate dehydratase